LINEKLEEIETDPSLTKEDYPHDFNGDYGLVSYGRGLWYSIIDRTGRVLVKEGLGNMYGREVVDGKICYARYYGSGDDRNEYPFIYNAYENNSFRIDIKGTCASNIHNGKVVLVHAVTGSIKGAYLYDVDKCEKISDIYQLGEYQHFSFNPEAQRFQYFDHEAGKKKFFPGETQ